MARNGQNPAWRPKNGPSHRAEPGTYDPVELGLSMAKNGVSSVKRKKKPNFWQKMGPGSWPEARLVTGSTQKCCLLGVHCPRPVMNESSKKFGQFPKKNGTKKLHFRHNNLHFIRHTYETPIFGLRRTRLFLRIWGTNDPKRTTLQYSQHRKVVF